MLIVDFPPVGPEVDKLDMNTMMKAVGADAPQRGLPPSNPLMHRTRTVDYAIILQRVQNWSDYTVLIERLNNDPDVKTIDPVALSLPVDGGGRYAAAQIYDWTLAHSRKPEMAIN
jgi:hypothetical protein